MLKGGAQDRPLPPFHPIEGLEATEVSYIDWLIAGGKPANDYMERAWADTERGGLPS